MLAGGEAGIRRHEDLALVCRQSQEEGGVAVVLAAGGATHGLSGARAEAESALRAIQRAGGFGLELVHAGEVEFAAEANLVAGLRPIEVTYIGVLGVVAVVRHEVIIDADVRVATDRECGPAALETARPIDAGDSQIQAEVLIQAGLLHAGIHSCPAEIRVHDEMRRKDVSGSTGKAVGISSAGSRVGARR